MSDRVDRVPVWTKTKPLKLPGSSYVRQLITSLQPKSASTTSLSTSSTSSSTFLYTVGRTGLPTGIKNLGNTCYENASMMSFSICTFLLCRLI